MSVPPYIWSSAPSFDPTARPFNPTPPSSSLHGHSAPPTTSAAYTSYVPSPTYPAAGFGMPSVAPPRPQVSPGTMSPGVPAPRGYSPSHPVDTGFPSSSRHGTGFAPTDDASQWWTSQAAPSFHSTQAQFHQGQPLPHINPNHPLMRAPIPVHHFNQPSLHRSFTGDSPDWTETHSLPNRYGNRATTLPPHGRPSLNGGRGRSNGRDGRDRPWERGREGSVERDSGTIRNVRQRQTGPPKAVLGGPGGKTYDELQAQARQASLPLSIPSGSRDALSPSPNRSASSSSPTKPEPTSLFKGNPVHVKLPPEHYSPPDTPRRFKTHHTENSMEQPSTPPRPRKEAFPWPKIKVHTSPTAIPLPGSPNDTSELDIQERANEQDPLSPPLVGDVEGKTMWKGKEVLVSTPSSSGWDQLRKKWSASVSTLAASQTLDEEVKPETVSSPTRDLSSSPTHEPLVAVEDKVQGAVTKQEDDPAVEEEAQPLSTTTSPTKRVFTGNTFLKRTLGNMLRDPATPRRKERAADLSSSTSLNDVADSAADVRTSDSNDLSLDHITITTDISKEMVEVPLSTASAASVGEEKTTKRRRSVTDGNDEPALAEEEVVEKPAPHGSRFGSSALQRQLQGFLRADATAFRPRAMNEVATTAQELSLQDVQGTEIEPVPSLPEETPEVAPLHLHENRTESESTVVHVEEAPIKTDVDEEVQNPVSKRLKPTAAAFVPRLQKPSVPSTPDNSSLLEYFSIGTSSSPPKPRGATFGINVLKDQALGHQTTASTSSNRSLRATAEPFRPTAKPFTPGLLGESALGLFTFTHKLRPTAPVFTPSSGQNTGTASPEKKHLETDVETSPGTKIHFFSPEATSTPIKPRHSDDSESVSETSRMLGQPDSVNISSYTDMDVVDQQLASDSIVSLNPKAQVFKPAAELVVDSAVAEKEKLVLAWRDSASPRSKEAERNDPEAREPSESSGSPEDERGSPWSRKRSAQRLSQNSYLPRVWTDLSKTSPPSPTKTSSVTIHPSRPLPSLHTTPHASTPPEYEYALPSEDVSNDVGMPDVPQSAHTLQMSGSFGPSPVADRGELAGLPDTQQIRVHESPTILSGVESKVFVFEDQDSEAPLSIDDHPVPVRSKLPANDREKLKQWIFPLSPEKRPLVHRAQSMPEDRGEELRVPNVRASPSKSEPGLPPLNPEEIDAGIKRPQEVGGFVDTLRLNDHEHPVDPEPRLHLSPPRSDTGVASTRIDYPTSPGGLRVYPFGEDTNRTSLELASRQTSVEFPLRQEPRRILSIVNDTDHLTPQSANTESATTTGPRAHNSSSSLATTNAAYPQTNGSQVIVLDELVHSLEHQVEALKEANAWLESESRRQVYELSERMQATEEVIHSAVKEALQGMDNHRSETLLGQVATILEEHTSLLHTIQETTEAPVTAVDSDDSTRVDDLFKALLSGQHAMMERFSEMNADSEVQQDLRAATSALLEAREDAHAREAVADDLGSRLEGMRKRLDESEVARRKLESEFEVVKGQRDVAEGQRESEREGGEREAKRSEEMREEVKELRKVMEELRASMGEKDKKLEEMRWLVEATKGEADASKRVLEVATAERDEARASLSAQKNAEADGEAQIRMAFQQTVLEQLAKLDVGGKTGDEEQIRELKNELHAVRSKYEVSQELRKKSELEISSMKATSQLRQAEISAQLDKEQSLRAAEAKRADAAEERETELKKKVEEMERQMAKVREERDAWQIAANERQTWAKMAEVRLAAVHQENYYWRQFALDADRSRMRTYLKTKPFSPDPAGDGGANGSGNGHVNGQNGGAGGAVKLNEDEDGGTWWGAK